MADSFNVADLKKPTTRRVSTFGDAGGQPVKKVALASRRRATQTFYTMESEIEKARRELKWTGLEGAEKPADEMIGEIRDGECVDRWALGESLVAQIMHCTFLAPWPS